MACITNHVINKLENIGIPCIKTNWRQAVRFVIKIRLPKQIKKIKRVFTSRQLLKARRKRSSKLHDAYMDCTSCDYEGAEHKTIIMISFISHPSFTLQQCPVCYNVQQASS